MIACRRSALRTGAAALLACAFGVKPAFAGSYLNRAALLLHQARREGEYLRPRYGDKELARIVHEVARARLQAASGMMVPKEVVQAHPHLLLVLENYERAAEAAINLMPEKFLLALQRAQDEERTFRVVMKQLGWDIPSVHKDDDGPNR
ncbi:MAG TPA: hypothetical protein VFQ61_13790 [Polyangiaceae bacterium]|nr:hypothetical protein [Polyangiaceae bacterium]